MDTKAIANGTIAALEQGHYVAPGGRMVDISALVETCVNGSQSYNPADLVAIQDHVLSQRGATVPTTFALANETTLQGCMRLTAGQQYQRIGVLNFASAKHPGGGFLRGARAQEESLARSSGLYYSLRQYPQYYAFHQSLETCLYSDHMIYSPACPVMRDDAGNWLSQPYVVDFITSPAPNAGAIMQNEPHNRARIITTLAERAGKILALAAYKQCDALILGAWGCGVFRNDPVTVAAIFSNYLKPAGSYNQRFRHVFFAVYDSSRAQVTYQAFATQFASLV